MTPIFPSNNSPSNMSPKNGEPETHSSSLVKKLSRDGDSEENTHSPHKKPVRRRGQARKPYHEKRLNMAEARREIVAALKLHRASMKQARENKPAGPEIETGPENQRFGPVSHQSPAEQEARLTYRRNPRIYASSDYVSNINAYIPGLYSSPYYSRPVSSTPPPLIIQENPNFVLPSKTLGLNLNLEDFNNLDTSFFCSSANSSSIYNPFSSTSCMAGAPATDTRSIGDDQRKTGWGDELNFGISVVRAELLEPMGIGPDPGLVTEDFAVSSPFDEVMEFPAWVSADVCGGDYCAALPCMDIKGFEIEIEGIDGDWLA